MNANGNPILLTYGSTNYYFDELYFSFVNRIETTPLIGGGSIRVRSGDCAETITLKGKIRHGDIFTYESLLKKLSQGIAEGLKINMKAYEGYTLLSGKIKSEERETESVCEIVLTEADE